MDRSTLLIKIKIQWSTWNITSNTICFNKGLHLSEHIRYHLVSIILLTYKKNFKNFSLLEYFGNPSSLLIKMKIQQITWNIPWKLGTSLDKLGASLSEFGFTHITLNQNKTYCFTYKNLLLREKEPDNGKLHLHWNHSNVSLNPLMTKEKHHYYRFGA